jgi:hypothetical protein
VGEPGKILDRLWYGYQIRWGSEFIISGLIYVAIQCLYGISDVSLIVEFVILRIERRFGVVGLIMDSYISLMLVGLLHCTL